MIKQELLVFLAFFVGTRLNVTIFVYDVSDLQYFQVLLKYDSTVMNATRAWIPSDETDYVFYGKQSVSPGIYFYYDDPIYGTSVLVGDSLLSTEDTFTGTGLLAIIEFEIIEAPDMGEALSCNLSIDNLDTFLVDSHNNDIVTIKTNGYYQYTWVELLEPYLETKPPRYDAAKLETFDISVWLNNIASSHRLVNITFKLSYDATLLNVTQVAEGPFLTEIGATTFDYTDEAGNVTVLNYLVPPYTSFPEGDGEIAIITFQGIYQDAEEHSCDLKLHDIQLLNDNMNPVPFPPELTRHCYYTIRPATSLITINLSKDLVVIGSNVTIDGTITPIRKGVEVTIHYRFVGFLWENLSTPITDDDGRYTYTWSPDESGTFEFYASWPGDNFILGDESDVSQNLEIVYKEQSTVTINIDPGTLVVVGQNITIKGTIQPKRAHVNVTIYYRPAGETNWILLETVLTDSQSRYTCTWLGPEIGKYEVKASWLGDASTLEASSDIITVEIVETLPVDFMAYLPYVLGGIAIVAVVVIVYFKKVKKR